MKQLFVTVHTPEAQSATYCFNQMPILVGRSPECHLSICHEAVPRELCRAWVEDDGTTVRVEERPALTNPLRSANREIRGGLSGERLLLNVGPIEIVLCATTNHAIASPSRHKKLLRRGAPVLCACVVLAATLALLGNTGDKGKLSNFPKLPESPVPTTNIELIAPSRAKAEVLSSRAGEILERPQVVPGDKVEGILLLTRAAMLFQGIDDKEANRHRGMAETILSEINNEYRRQVLALRHALETGDEVSSSKIAAVLLEYLEHSKHPAKRRLRELAEGRTK